MATVNDLVNRHGYVIEYIKRDTLLNMASNHYHHYYEIYYQLSGERYYFIKDRSYYLTKGNIVLINSYDLHKTLHAGEIGRASCRERVYVLV